MKSKVNLTQKHFYMFTGLVAVLGLGLTYITYSSNSETVAKIETLKTELRDEQEVQQELTAMQKKVQELSTQLNHLESGVQQAAYIPTLLKELEDYGKKNKMTILQLKPIYAPPSNKKEDKKKREDAYLEMNVNVKARGQYYDALRFLNALKVFPKIVAVRTVSIAPKQDASGSRTAGQPKLDIDFELRAYAFKEEAKPAKTDPAPAEKPIQTNKTAMVTTTNVGAKS